MYRRELMLPAARTVGRSRIQESVRRGSFIARVGKAEAVSESRCVPHFCFTTDTERVVESFEGKLGITCFILTTRNLRLPRRWALCNLPCDTTTASGMGQSRHRHLLKMEVRARIMHVSPGRAGDSPPT